MKDYVTFKYFRDRIDMKSYIITFFFTKFEFRWLYLSKIIKKQTNMTQNCAKIEMRFKYTIADMSSILSTQCTLYRVLLIT